MKPVRERQGRNVSSWAEPNRMVDIVNPKAEFTPRQRAKMLEAYVYNRLGGLTVSEQAAEYGVDPSSLRRMVRKEAARRGIELVPYTKKDEF